MSTSVVICGTKEGKPGGMTVTRRLLKGENVIMKDLTPEASKAYSMLDQRMRMRSVVEEFEKRF